MKAMTLAAAAALMALTGCGQLGLGKAERDAAANGGAAAGNSAAVKPAEAAAANGQAAADPGAGLGGKDGPAAIQASASIDTAAGVTLDRAYVTGRWTDDEDCDNASDFFANGTYQQANGEQGAWTLAGDRLTMQSDRGTLAVQLVPVDRNSITVVNADGSLGRSTRC